MSWWVVLWVVLAALAWSSVKPRDPGQKDEYQKGD